MIDRRIARPRSSHHRARAPLRPMIRRVIGALHERHPRSHHHMRARQRDLNRPKRRRHHPHSRQVMQRRTDHHPRRPNRAEVRRDRRTAPQARQERQRDAIQPRRQDLTRHHEVPRVVTQPHHGPRNHHTSRRQRRPANVTTARPPVNPRRSPDPTRHPRPAVARHRDPAAIVKRSPAPVPLGHPGPAVVGVVPASAGVIGRKVGPDHVLRRHPDLTVLRALHPLTVGSQRIAEVFMRGRVVAVVDAAVALVVFVLATVVGLVFIVEADAIRRRLIDLAGIGLGNLAGIDVVVARIVDRAIGLCRSRGAKDRDTQQGTQGEVHR